ncbi:MAG TPA: M50 family metallopeptidase [Clostridiaceae bacterium]|nr:M50 family metallopeptidase [Clostridiaceae bacterium]
MKRFWKYLLILVAVVALWNTGIIKPLKLFAVFLHELGHAFMGLVFGYGLQELNIGFNESGYALVKSKSWFSSFMVANGGYLGSVLFALLILYLKRTFFKRYILGTLAVIFMIVSIKYSGFSFTLIYSIIFTALVLLIYMVDNENVIEWAIDIMGISSLAYAVYDTFVDTILLQINLKFHLIRGWKVEQPLTDAVQLAQMTGIPAIVWGIIWIIISMFAIYMVLLKDNKSRKRYY